MEKRQKNRLKNPIGDFKMSETELRQLQKRIRGVKIPKRTKPSFQLLTLERSD